METLNFILSDSNFPKTVLKRAENMGMDSAIYFTIGEYQSKFNDNNDEFFQDDDVMELIINQYPELEY